MGLVPDFILDFIDVSTFWTILFTFHALLAVSNTMVPQEG